MSELPEKNHQNSRHKFVEEIGKKEARKIRRRREKGIRSVWYGMGMSGIIGWSVAIPTIIGITVGIWIDRKWPGHLSWTLMLLMAGVALGCLNAWYWIKQESRNE